MSLEDKQQQYETLIKNFSTAMMVSKGTVGFHARPMHILHGKDQSEVWFASSIDSEKVKEFKQDPHTVLTFQTNNKFMSLAGTACITQDKQKN